MPCIEFVPPSPSLHLLVHAPSYMPRATKMFRQALWMGLFKHQTPKRTLLWSTSRAIGLFNLGTLTKHNYRSLVSTTKRYRDKQGKVRYQGSDALKGTQHLGLLNKQSLAPTISFQFT